MSNIDASGIINNGITSVGGTAILIGWLTSGATSVTSYIIGYSALSIKALLYLVNMIYLISNRYNQPNMMLSKWFRLYAITTVIAMFVLFAITVSMIVLMGMYGSDIGQHRVADNYYSYTGYIVVCLGGLFALSSNIMKYDSKPWDNNNVTKLNSIAMFTLMLNIILACIVYQTYIMLRDFRTDGFSILNLLR